MSSDQKSDPAQIHSNSGDTKSPLKQIESERCEDRMENVGNKKQKRLQEKDGAFSPMHPIPPANSTTEVRTEIFSQVIGCMQRR